MKRLKTSDSLKPPEKSFRIGTIVICTAMSKTIPQLYQKAFELFDRLTRARQIKSEI